MREVLKKVGIILLTFVIMLIFTEKTVIGISNRRNKSKYSFTILLGYR